MLLRFIVIIAIAAVSMGFFKSGEQVERERFDSFIGNTMQQFTDRTLYLPDNMTEGERGRDYWFNRGNCTAVMRTEQIDDRGKASSWRIWGYSYQGWCGAF